MQLFSRVIATGIETSYDCLKLIFKNGVPLQIFLFLATISALSPILLLIVIILWHWSKPDSIWAVVLNEWQTLAAALIGFSALATTLLLQSQIDRNELNFKQMKLDWAVIIGIREDLKHLNEEIDFILEEVTPTDDEMSEMDSAQCVSITARIRSFEHSPPAMTTILASYGAELTPTVVPIVTDATRVHAYTKNFGTVDFLADCSEAPTGTVVRYLVHLLAVMEKGEYMVEFINELELQTIGAPSYSPLETANPKTSKKIRQMLCKDGKTQFCLP